jgi:pimeloyl-ACP methyl ester carboxylesterase
MLRLAGDGLTLAVQDEGEGQPVLLLHGFPSSSHLWRDQVAALVKAGMRAIVPDLRGFGESDKPAFVEEYALVRSVSDVIAVLDGLGVQRSHVVGQTGCGHRRQPLDATRSARAHQRAVAPVLG